MTAQDRFPFNRAYWDSTYTPGRYTRLYVATVNTDFTLRQNAWQRLNIRQNQLEADTRRIADYMRTSLINAAAQDPNHRFAVVEAPGPDTLVLEAALVELIPSKIILHSIGLATSAVQGIGATVGGVAAGIGARSSIAMEARVLDRRPGKVVAMFADREEPAARPIDLGGLKWYHYANATIDSWAAQIIEVMGSSEGHIVEDSAPFTLMPW